MSVVLLFWACALSDSQRALQARSLKQSSLCFWDVLPKVEEVRQRGDKESRADLSTPLVIH